MYNVVNGLPDFDDMFYLPTGPTRAVHLENETRMTQVRKLKAAIGNVYKNGGIRLKCGQVNYYVLSRKRLFGTRR